MVYVTTSYLRVMETTGFYHNGLPTSGVFTRESLENNKEKYIKYYSAIKEINVTGIYELSGSPCIYFTQLDQIDPNPQDLAKLHQLAWNHGLAPLLWVITPTKVLLYNCFSKPILEDQQNSQKHLIELFETLDHGLQQLKENAHRVQFESGEFWQWEKAKNIQRNERVDKVLVDDLTDTEEKLVEEKGLKRSVAQSLLIQSIFIAYLEDREILKADFFNQLFNVNNFSEVLEDKQKVIKFFRWIQDTFNGDLFPLCQEEINLIQVEHLAIIKSFIGGQQEIKTGQLRLWRMYDFKVIPIELISSIYEKFIYAEDAKSARENSTHYTPINLVDIVLSEVFKGLDGKAKVLDLSCGSGVFLVESLRRLIVKRWMNGEEPSRKLIRETLYHQIYGVDINSKAISIAAFSLYLTALELDYELEQNQTISDDLKFESIIGRNLFGSDAFNEQADFNQQEPFSNRNFDAIVGNPPWTKSKNNQSATHIKYCQKNGYTIAHGNPPDQAFLWRIGDFSNKNTIIGILVHGKPFFSNDEKAVTAKKELFSNFKIQILINFSKLRREKLFPKSEAPALIIIAKGEKQKQEDICYFVCPDRTVDYREHKIIEIGAENIKKLSVFEIANDSDMLKVSTWGSARDKYLIKQLKYHQTNIESISKNSPKSGLIVGNNGKDSPSWLFNKKMLPTGSLSRYEIKTSNLEFFNYTKVQSPREESIYQSPLVIIPGKITSDGVYCAYSRDNIIYNKSCSGISISPDLNYIAHYLNGIINSSISSYFLFLTASSWGIERNQIATQDLARLPIPDPNKLDTKKLNKLLELEFQLRQCNDKSEEKQLKQKLDQAVFDIYDFNAQEQILVEDMTEITIDWYMNREKSQAIKKPKFNQLEAYANALISVIQPFLNTLNERKITAEIFEIKKAPLQVIKFSIVPVSDSKPTIQKNVIQELELILMRIAEKLPQKIADRIYTKRNVRIYLENELYIVKPAKLIDWSRSSGLNDADMILAEHLGVNNASFG